MQQIIKIPLEFCKGLNQCLTVCYFVLSHDCHVEPFVSYITYRNSSKVPKFIDIAAKCFCLFFFLWKIWLDLQWSDQLVLGIVVQESIPDFGTQPSCLAHFSLCPFPVWLICIKAIRVTKSQGKIVGFFLVLLQSYLKYRLPARQQGVVSVWYLKDLWSGQIALSLTGWKIWNLSFHVLNMGENTGYIFFKFQIILPVLVSKMLIVHPSF